jgi:copper transport protein
MVGVTSRHATGVQPVAPVAAPTWPAGSQRLPGAGPPGPPTPHKPPRKLRKIVLSVAAAALIAAAFALVVAALQPQRRAPVTRPTTTAVPGAPVTAAPPVSTAPASPSAVDPGPIGRTLDQRLQVTRQIERVGFVSRWIGMAGALLLMGMAVFLLVVFPDDGSDASSPFEGQGRLRSLTILLVLLTILGELTELPLQAAVAADRGWVGATDPDTLLFVAAGPVAVSCLLRVAGVVLILGMLVGRFATVKRPFSVVRGGLAVVGGFHLSGRTSRRVAMAVGIAVTLSSFVVVGHAQASQPRALLIVADMAHVLAASVWLGGVVMLAVMLRRLRRIRKAAPLHSPDPGLLQARSEMAVVVGRFSVAATLCVAFVTVAGVALAISQISSLETLYRTPYGITLVVKLVMVGFVMLLGGYNHQFLVPRVIANPDDERAWRKMRQAVQTEVLVILFGVLVATVALSSGGFSNVIR